MIIARHICENESIFVNLSISLFSFINKEVHFNLEFILIVDLVLAGPKFLGEREAFGHVFRRHKVINDLNTAVEVLYLCIVT